MLRNLIILGAALSVSGCLSQSQIQGKYVKSQNICRAQTAKLLSSNGSVPDSQAVGTSFSECMNKAGWRVPAPKPPAQVATGPVPNPPTGSPSTNPTAATAVAPQPQPAAAPQPVVAQNPPSGAPSVNPSASAARVAGPTPARYQPARPTTVPEAPYGRGAGRQF